MALPAITSPGLSALPEKDTMVTPEYARAYMNEISRLVQPRDSVPQRVSIARLLRRLSR